MPVLRKLFMLAVTTGVARKAWDAWRGRTPGAARPAANERRRSERERRTQVWGKDRPGGN